MQLLVLDLLYLCACEGGYGGKRVGVLREREWTKKLLSKETINQAPCEFSVF